MTHARTLATPLLLAALLAACGDDPSTIEPAATESERPAAAERAGEDEIERLAERLAAKLAGREVEAVAVVDFQDLRGGTSELGRYLAQELGSALVTACAELAPEAPRVIDRHRLEEILDERRRVGDGLVSSAGEPGGEIGGAAGLVTGKVVSFADTIHLSVHVLDYRDEAAILVADEASLPRTARLNELEGRTLKVRSGTDVDILEIWAPQPAIQSYPLRDDDTGEIELRIDLMGCGRLEEDVYCLFSLEAVDDDTTVYLYGYSGAVLPDGSKADADLVQIGASTASGPKGRAGFDLVHGVPTSAALRLDGVPEDVAEIVRLTLALQGEDAVFEQVPIDRI